jgi:hypothetical protein
MRQTVRNLRKKIYSNRPLAALLRRCNNPFASKEFNLLHCCHHRVGTVWFKRILSSISLRFFIPFYQRNRVDQEIEFPRKPFIYLDTHSLLDVSKMTDYRGTHIIRDPRDLVVSGYYYHLWTDEEWANLKISELLKAVPMLRDRMALLPLHAMMDVSYREYLNRLPKEEGLLSEIKRASCGPIKVMREWGYNNANFLEIKYEDLLHDEEKSFRKIFSHYGFKPSAIDTATEIALSYSFKRISRRDIGQVEKQSHMRSGKIQQWKDEFGEVHKKLFKELHGNDLIKFGYETDLNW